MENEVDQKGNTQDSQQKFDNVAIIILKWGSIGLAIFAVAIGIVSLFFDKVLGEDPDKAVIWFGLAVVAVLVPFIREITIRDMHFIIKDLKAAKESLDATNLTSRQLQARLTATRSELINRYQIYLEKLPPEKRDQKIIEMSRLYIEEMGLDIEKVKKWLVKLGYEVGNLDDEITPVYIDAIKEFQIKNELGDDGVFGYRTYDKICQIIKKEK